MVSIRAMSLGVLCYKVHVQVLAKVYGFREEELELMSLSI